MDIDADSAQVKTPPPLMLVLMIVIGAVIHWIYPVYLVPGRMRWILGAPLIIISVGIVLYCAGLFKKAHTNIEPWKPTSQIITTGLYGISRNPIYLAFVLFGIGIAFLVNTLWILVIMIPLILLIDRNVIAKEERYLEHKFGQEYLDYKNQVRRWI